MSKEVVIVAIATPASGKLERFKEASAQAAEWIRDNEPETLQFEINEVQTDEGVKIVLFERYASKEAMERHEASENYNKFFGQVMEEKMLEGSPVLMKGEPRAGFRR